MNYPATYLSIYSPACISVGVDRAYMHVAKQNR